MFPHILGYAAFLSIFFRLFGESLMTAALVNVVLTVLSGALLYHLCLKHQGKTAAFFAFLFWSLCPSKLLYNTMSLSEPFYTCLFLLFFVLTSAVVDVPRTEEQIGKAISAGLFSGMTLGMINAARPIGIIPIIAFFLWLFFLSDWKTVMIRKKTILLFSCFLLLAYFAAGRIWNSYAAEKLEQSPPSIPGYSIYVGFNPETQGSYADEDMDLLQSRYFGEYDRNAERAQQSMLESAKIRIAENRNSIPSLMLHKLGTLLGHDEGGAFYSKVSLSDRTYSLWCMISNIWYYLVCMLCVAGCVRAWRNPSGDSGMIVPLCLIGIVLAQLLVEVAARYHYCLVPMLLFLAAPALKKRQPSI
jgi:4-amino-4-deoxy-L-arabinose transferase-like glycosyltransferase